MGEKNLFSVETLVLRHRQEIGSLTMYLMRVRFSVGAALICGSTGSIPVERRNLSLVNGDPTKTVFHYHPPIVLLCLKYY